MSRLLFLGSYEIGQKMITIYSITYRL